MYLACSVSMGLTMMPELVCGLMNSGLKYSHGKQLRQFDALLWVPATDLAEGQLCQWWRDVLLYCVVCRVERICSMPKQHSV